MSNSSSSSLTRAAASAQRSSIGMRLPSPRAPQARSPGRRASPRCSGALRRGFDVLSGRLVPAPDHREHQQRCQHQSRRHVPLPPLGALGSLRIARDRGGTPRRPLLPSPEGPRNRGERRPWPPGLRQGGLGPLSRHLERFHNGRSAARSSSMLPHTRWPFFVDVTAYRYRQSETEQPLQVVPASLLARAGSLLLYY